MKPVITGAAASVLDTLIVYVLVVLTQFVKLVVTVTVAVPSAFAVTEIVPFAVWPTDFASAVSVFSTTTSPAETTASLLDVTFTSVVRSAGSIWHAHPFPGVKHIPSIPGILSHAAGHSGIPHPAYCTCTYGDTVIFMVSPTFIVTLDSSATVVPPTSAETAIVPWLYFVSAACGFVSANAVIPIVEKMVRILSVQASNRLETFFISSSLLKILRVPGDRRQHLTCRRNTG